MAAWKAWNLTPAEKLRQAVDKAYLLAPIRAAALRLAATTPNALLPDEAIASLVSQSLSPASNSSPAARQQAVREMLLAGLKPTWNTLAIAAACADEMLLAALQPEAETIRALWERIAPPDKQPLPFYARRVPVLRFLQERGGYTAMGEVRTSSGATLLHYTNHRPDAIRHLAACGVDIDATDNRGHTPLMTAPTYHAVETLLWLHKAKGEDAQKAALDARSADGLTALAHAVRHRSDLPSWRGRVELLLKAGADPNAPADQPNARPLANATENMISLQVMEAGGDPNFAFSWAQGEIISPLILAIKQHACKDTIERMVKAGADPSFVCNGRTALLYTLQAERFGSMIALLEAGADPSVVCNGHTALLYALQKNLHNYTVALLEAGADASAPNGLPLATAITTGQLAAVLELMHAGASPAVQVNGAPAVLAMLRMRTADCTPEHLILAFDTMCRHPAFRYPPANELRAATAGVAGLYEHVANRSARHCVHVLWTAARVRRTITLPKELWDEVIDEYLGGRGRGRGGEEEEEEEEEDA